MPSPRTRTRSRALPLVLLALAFAALLAVFEWDVTRRDRVVASPRTTAAQPARAGVPPPEVSAPAELPRSVPLTQPSAPALASSATPADVESRCHGIGAFGLCEGNTARACIANAIYAVDCAAHAMRCVVTREGAQCLPANDPSACDGSEPPRCVGDHLRQCVDGSFQEVDCALRGAACSERHDGARCASPREHDKQKPEPEARVELCDGRDNDGDDRIDEQDVCAPVPLVAFIPRGYDPPELESRMQIELAIMNQVYAPTTFRWVKSASSSEVDRIFDPRRLDTAARELARGQYPSFYVPVLYVEDLLLSPPKAAISTMPNNRCGGVRLTDQSALADGLIVLGEGRQPETLAHEMGHYLGLCHTHQELAPLAATGALASEPECERSGDGICDTAPDPGPNRCLRDQLCEVVCLADPAQPDPTNIMSYYLGCRRVLTPEQLAEARRNLSLRRGWFACLDPASCECNADPHACPSEMSCQPSPSSDAMFTCQLDGPGVPGSACDAGHQCGHGSFCLQLQTRASSSTRCVRPCQEGDACDCSEVGLPLRICAEDMPNAPRSRTRL